MNDTYGIWEVTLLFLGEHKLIIGLLIGVFVGLIVAVFHQIQRKIHQEEREERIGKIEDCRNTLKKNFHSGDEAWQRAILKLIKGNDSLSNILDNPKKYCSQSDYDLVAFFVEEATALRDTYVEDEVEAQAWEKQRKMFEPYYEQLRPCVENLPLAMLCGKKVYLCELCLESELEVWYEYDYSETELAKFCKRLGRYEERRDYLVKRLAYVCDTEYYATLRSIAIEFLEAQEQNALARKSKKYQKFKKKCENSALPKWLRDQIVIDFR